MSMTPLEIAQQCIRNCTPNRLPAALKLSHIGLTEIPEQLSELTWLEELDISDNYISDLSTLPDLPQLQKLHLSGNKVSNLNGLSHVPQLKELGCAYNKIRNLDGLRYVPLLQDFSCWHNKINNLDFLVHVPRLLRLMCGQNQISNLIPLKYVPLLQMLICQANQISDLSPLSSLEQLQALDCRLNEISDLSVLSNLMQLQTLDCRFNRIKSLHPIHDLVTSKRLNGLHAYDNPVFEIPAGILGEHDYDNCIESLRNYWQDLANGSEKQRQLKVQLVGNGRVGKTTLAYALEHKRAPSEPFKPTHGIVIKEIQQALDGEEEPVTLQLWDFGGQEIYHATHRLFLSDDCLYLLLWAEETEEHPDETRHPISYWLEAIHDLAPNSPVILVKNQIDLSDRLPTRPAELTEDMPGVKQIRQEVKISAMQYRGIPALRGAIESVLEELKHRVCLELPTSWLQVQRELKQLGQNTIPFAHFKQLCIKAGVGHAEWFAGYLHKTGALFYREGTFQNQIILDQNWAINAVYHVFDPNKPHRRRIERMGGRFCGEDASLFWADEEAKEHEVYIDFMRNCGICYEPKQQHNKPFAEREFIIPALLPLTSKAKTAWGDTRPEDWQLDIEYPFLHRSIIERIILRLGETYEVEPWRTGIFCHTDEGQLLLECEYTNKQQSTQGRLHFQLRGNHLDCLVYALRKLVSETSPHRRYQEFLRKGTEERTELPEFKENPQMPTPLDETKPASKTVKLFISYSHADEAHKNELKLCLENIKRRLPLEYWDDRQMFAGELVNNQILSRLEAADIVVLLISRNFFASDYCFSIEMEKSLKRYEQNHNVVIPIIIRPTDDWREFDIGKITVLPTDGKPLCDWSSSDKFWADVQQGIRKQVEKRLQT